jgi:hypothetical protein
LTASEGINKRRSLVSNVKITRLNSSDINQELSLSEVNSSEEIYDVSKSGSNNNNNNSIIIVDNNNGKSGNSNNNISTSNIVLDNDVCAANCNRQNDKSESL